MLRAVKFSFVKSPDRDPRGTVALVRSIDLILRSFDVEPVIWDCQEIEGPYIRWIGYIPPDCEPAFERVAEYLVQLIKEHADKRGGELKIRKN